MVKSLEETLASTRKDLISAQESAVKFQRDLREVRGTCHDLDICVNVTLMYGCCVAQSVAQREDQEERIATLEKRYLNAQRQSCSIHDINDKLDSELALKDQQLKSVRTKHVFTSSLPNPDCCFSLQTEEKLAHLLEKLELADQKLAKQAEQLPSVEAEVQQRLRALSKVSIQSWIPSKCSLLYM